MSPGVFDVLLVNGDDEREVLAGPVVAYAMRSGIRKGEQLARAYAVATGEDYTAGEFDRSANEYRRRWKGTDSALEVIITRRSQ